MNRRQFVQLATGAAAAAMVERSPASLADHDFRLEIAPVSVELAPGVTLRTTGYNGQTPGPVLRMLEGSPVTVAVTNRTGQPEMIHWHGLHLGSLPDGAIEAASPMVPAGATRSFSVTPAPSGTRWYHTQTAALTDLNRGSQSGQFGFLLVEPRSHPGAYDQEVLLAVHHWEPSLLPGGNARPGIAYRYASFNGRLLHAAEPLRVSAGQRVLFRLLNASATEDVLLSLPGHRFTVIALDGNAVPCPSSVEVLSLGVAERIDAVVEMNTPGNWILGSLDPAERKRGLGLRVEYAHRHGPAQWHDPTSMDWSYARFSHRPPAALEPDEVLDMLFEKTAASPEGPGGCTIKRSTTKRSTARRSTVNWRSSPETEALSLVPGRRYRLRMMNATGRAHPVHLPGKGFELTRVNQAPLAGILKDTVRLERYNVVEADFVASHPAPILFPSHQQLHVDYGSMQAMPYKL